MSDGVLETTIADAKAHPWLIGGAVVGLVAIIWLLSSGSSSKPQSFQFSYGPSDAQLKAGAASHIADVQAQTQVSMAHILSDAGAAHDASQAGIYHDYFGYLATSSALAAGVQQSGIAAQVAINGSNNATAAQIASGTNATNIALANISSADTMQGYATQYSIAHDTNASNERIAAGNNAAANFKVSGDVAMSESHDYQSGVLALIARGGQ